MVNARIAPGSRGPCREPFAQEEVIAILDTMLERVNYVSGEVHLTNYF